MTRTACGLATLLLGVTLLGAQEPEPRLERRKANPEGPELLPRPQRELPPIDGPMNPQGGNGPLAPDELEKTRERVIENSKSAAQRLGERDPGEKTRDVQKEILKDLDELLKQAQNQQNQGGGGGSGSSGGMSGGGSGGGGGSSSSSTASGGASGSSGRQERQQRREQAKKNGGKGESGGRDGKEGGQQLAQNQGKDGQGKDGQGKQGQGKEGQGKDGGKDGKEPRGMASNGKESGSPTGGRPNDPNARPEAKFAEVYKDVWGHLPEKLRQEMDLYYREQFMPRYSDLLREYYSSLAEQKRKP